MLYLMGSSKTDIDVYNGVNSEEAVDWGLWEKAYDYFVDLADNGKDTEGVREALLSIGPDLGLVGFNLQIGTVIKGWHLYSDGMKITKADVEIKLGTNKDGQLIISEAPRIGGIDVEIPKEERIKGEPPQDFGVCPKNGKHEDITEDGETFCKHCMDPYPHKAVKKGK